ncbi:MAG: glycogen/starch/alpha-glucan phosphorylase [Angelakisella sp.]
MNFAERTDEILRRSFGKQAENASVKELYQAISGAALEMVQPQWQGVDNAATAKRACYLSAEFLIGRLFYSNLMNMGLLEECNRYLAEHGGTAADFEQVEDDALGNGGLGRLAACFLDSAATQGYALDGYGIRYRYGLFRQSFVNGFQQESPDNWLTWGDPWSVRREEETVLVQFCDSTVRAVPYDMPVIGWQQKRVNTLRLWQAEPVNEFNFDLFNRQQYDASVAEKNRAEEISAVLYPNDDTNEGKRLRLRQQYFFASASIQCMMRSLLRTGGAPADFAARYAVQLNDTHPVVAIPELLRLLMEQHRMTFEQALPIVRATFGYTNHTVMPEALEKWDVALFATLLPEVYPYVVLLQNSLDRELDTRGIARESQPDYAIRKGGRVEMANMAVYASHSTNGVAQIHTQILRNRVLAQWNRLYPERISNKTNGITQRRWLALCNPELAGLLTGLLGDGWITDLNQLERLAEHAGDRAVLERFLAVKQEKKRQLADYIAVREGIRLNPEFIFDIQIKRLHEYKRQLLSAFAILDTYFGIKEGRIVNLTPTAWIFGAKSAPGYRRAKGIIKLINEIAKLVDGDAQVRDRMQVVFVQNYNVSYAERLIPAAEVSEQISTAGTEASGTGNMKLMLNGAVTLGTMDGANIEIVEQAGKENNYIFGATVEELAAVQDSYAPMTIYQNSPRIHKILDALVDGTLDDGGTGDFAELRRAILKGASWHKPDHYYLLLDFERYCDARQRMGEDYRDRLGFARKELLNTAHAGKFSSDRTVAQYAEEIWGI